MPENAAQVCETPGLRPGSSQDFDFAFRVYRDTMREYSSAYIRWDDTKQEANLAQQLREAEMSVITLKETDVGWLAVKETGKTLLLGHFYIQRNMQGRGIGTEILRRLLACAAGKRKPVELAVLKNNPARHLYERAGFVIVGEDTMKYFMRRSHGI